MNARLRWLAAVTWVTASVCTVSARAHCDTLDGPVVSAARKALDSGQLKPVLAWVPQRDEGEIRTAFEKTRKVRSSGGEARELADLYFFETVVRVHRLSEGASYTGLRPAGTTEPPVAAADQAMASGQLQDLAKLITERTEQGLHKHFDQVRAKQRFDPNDVEAGRAFAKAYVEFVHYAERLYNAAQALAPDSAQLPAARHTH